MYRYGSSSDLERRRFGGAFVVLRHTVVLVTLLGAGVAVMGAQTRPQPAGQTGTVAQQPSAAVKTPLNLQVPASEAMVSSSAAETDDVQYDVAKAEPGASSFAAMMHSNGSQYGGRPRYRSSYTNADGSDKWMGYGGAGLTVPVGDAKTYLTPSYALQVGVGRQFSKHFALPVEFDWDHFGFTKQNLDNQIVVYDALFGTGAVDGLLDGGSHVWSFSLQPTYTFHQGDTWGAYGLAGVGFYHKTATFTIPSLAQFCSGFGGYGGYGYGYGYGGFGYGGCSFGIANQPIDSYTSNAPGFDGGIGLTYKFSAYSRLQLYAEARYVFVDNSYRPGITINNLSSINARTTNFYPANSDHTAYFPIKFGIRF